MAGFYVCGFHVAFYSVHLSAFVADKGLNPNVAVIALTVVGVANLAGTYIAGQSSRYVQKRQGLSLIPEQNIGLAIIKDSCEIDCNPKRKVVLRSSMPLVQQSQHQVLASPTQSLVPMDEDEMMTSTSGTPRRIPETLTAPTAPTSASGQVPLPPKLTRHSVVPAMAEPGA